MRTLGDVAFDRLEPHAAGADRLLRDDDLREHVAVVAVPARERGRELVDPRERDLGPEEIGVDRPDLGRRIDGHAVDLDRR